MDDKCGMSRRRASGLLTADGGQVSLDSKLSDGGDESLQIVSLSPV